MKCENDNRTICSYCGKRFIPAAIHMYRIKEDGKIKKQCSYTCYRKAGGGQGKYYTGRKAKKDE